MLVTTQERTLAKELSDGEIKALEEINRQMRIDILDMIYEGQSGHPGSSLSCIDILSLLWLKIMAHDAKKPDWIERDRFVLSKGHGAPALYAVLINQGYIQRDEIHTLRKLHTRLQGHPASKYLDGVDISTGSLGQGLSAAIGMALGLRLDNSPAHVYCLIGDGESQEGQIWEAMLSGAGHKLHNLTVICDRNGLQIDGETEKIKPLGEIAKKFASFGWQVIEADGHDLGVMYETLVASRNHSRQHHIPTMIVANCTKGKGVSFMENQAGWHGKAPNEDQYKAARAELETDAYFARLHPLRG